MSFPLQKTVYLSMAAALLLSSCQRQPYAFFSPSARPNYNTTTDHSTVSSVKPADNISASVNESTVPTRTVAPWSKDAQPMTTVVTEAAKPSTPQHPTKRRSLRKFFAFASSQPKPQTCDQIVLRNGDLIDAKVKEVGVNEIRYKKCDRPDGPDYTISKRDVLSIRYPNGEVERFGNTAAPSQSNSNRSSYSPPPADQGPRTDPFAIVAICAGAVGVLFGGFLLGPAAIVFGAISLSRIRKNPERFKGKGLAIGGMVAGIVAAAAYFLFYYAVI